jgi:hypothetical protein
MNCSAFSSGSIFLQHRTTSEYPRPSKETILDFDLPRPARPIKTPTTNHTKHPKKTATMVFPFFDLRKELRLQCYEEMLLITSTPAGKHSCSTAILRTCKQAHTEAQKILHEVNEIHIIIETEMCYSDRYGGSNLDMYSTSPEVTVGGGSRDLVRDINKRAPENIFEMASRWPAFVRKARKIRLNVVVRETATHYRAYFPHPRRGLVVHQPWRGAKSVFAELSQLVFSLASVAGACRELRVGFFTVRLADSAAFLDVERVFAGAAAFADVRKCELRIPRSTSAGAQIRARILGPAPMHSGKPIARIFDLERETRRVLALAATLAPGLVLSISDQAMMRIVKWRLNTKHLADDYLLDGAAEDLCNLLRMLETFMGMEATRRVLALSEGEGMDAMLLR